MLTTNVNKCKHVLTTNVKRKLLTTNVRQASHADNACVTRTTSVVLFPGMLFLFPALRKTGKLLMTNVKRQTQLRVRQDS